MWIVLATTCAVLAPVAGALLWFYILKSERGERYMKQRIQGPFVPVDSDHDQGIHKTK